MFRLLKEEGHARRGEFSTPHGVIQTPVFMNVGTQAAIKGALSAQDLEQLGCQVELSNTYHLHVRPGDRLIREMGGLHRFMTWSGPILTDSGGFQVFSLAVLRKIREEGVSFHSHVDGAKIFMGPEESMRIQSNLGSDIAMAFDECVKIPSPYDYVKESCARTTRWLRRCKAALAEYNAEPDAVNPGQVLFGINQGAVFHDIRVAHMQEIAALDLAGYAIGGLAVGETHQEMYDTIEAVEVHMPREKPRYLMGVGTPGNIIEGVHRGIDFFDCVMPSRNGRHGHLFTWGGVMNLNNQRYARDGSPIDPDCDCPVCRRYSRAYIRHLLKAQEPLALRLMVAHNLYFYNTLMQRIRDALDAGTFAAFRRDYSERLSTRI
ncbi:MAG: tRNA guanosine(34) transglycosylase Tgt [Oscillospiraceae bacterium]|nr:tRNA guanosine(34) transglycosylase Tgt [Oscillospiraceae bacterium]MCC8156531.1 tRNA guanosine(34) transglycosylase Tgt [Oscillospiraceae bacterium]MCD7743146.1 tRNA guanosine(34) transglycosylase Tgt [Oscillospiraceae bacterium]MCD8388795.1 tRNA guanosine(34) transglycosylase Tgt [Oscillospiraceae bacterium]